MEFIAHFLIKIVLKSTALIVNTITLVLPAEGDWKKKHFIFHCSNLPSFTY